MKEEKSKGAERSGDEAGEAEVARRRPVGGG